MLKFGSDRVLESLVENFIALMMMRTYASNVDVQIYFKNFDGINIAMNRFNPERYNGKLAQHYLT